MVEKFFVKWPLSVAETIAGLFTLISVIVMIVLGLVNTFETKEAARENRTNLQLRIDSFEEQTKIRIDSIENQTSKIRDAMDGVSRDVSYIRGRLEPKQ